MSRWNFVPVLTVASLLLAGQSGLARGNDLTITDGQGEGVQIKHGFFGHKTAIVKDRLGDGFAQKNGWFGTKEMNASVLGNELHRKKGIFGGTDVQGHDIFGDTVKTKKGIFGRRTTNVDVSGATNMIDRLFAGKPPTLVPFGSGNPPARALPGPSTGNSPLDRDVLLDPPVNH